MSTFSDKFSNHWKCIPYAMATLTSSDGFMVLFHLLRRGYTNENKTTCTISNKELAEVMGTSVSSIRRAIETLKKLNLIGCSQNKGTLCTFFINWDEIQAIHKISSQISDKGWVYLRGLCVNSEVRPISAIPMDILNDVVRQYPPSISCPICRTTAKIRNPLTPPASIRPPVRVSFRPSSPSTNTSRSAPSKSRKILSRISNFLKSGKVYRNT